MSADVIMSFCGGIAAVSVQAMASASEARSDGVDVRRFEAGLRGDVYSCLEHPTLDTRGESVALDSVVDVDVDGGSVVFGGCCR